VKTEDGLDNRMAGFSIETSPPIPVRIEWADSQGRVTASWLAAHFIFSIEFRSRLSPKILRRDLLIVWEKLDHKLTRP
jgi:hypothetical protein